MKKFILIKEKIIPNEEILGIDKIDKNISEPVAKIKKENRKWYWYLIPSGFKYEWIDRVQHEIKVEIGSGNPLWIEGSSEPSFDGAVSFYSPGHHVKDSKSLEFIYSSKDERDGDFMRIFKELNHEKN